MVNEEYDIVLKCKNFTSSWGGNRKLPHAFTEQGIYMLMTVLKGDLVTRQSKALIRAFKQMKAFTVEIKEEISKDDLKFEKDNADDEYSIDDSAIIDENKMNRLIDK